MTTPRVRPGSVIGLLLVLLSTGLLGSCTQPSSTDPGPPTAADPRAELIGSLEGADVEGYLFSLDEEQGRTTTSLTNPAVHEVVRLGEGDPGVVLRYSRVENRDERASDVFRTEVLRREAALALAVTDLATGEIVDEWPFPDGPACEQKFDSIAACIHEFNCASRGSLLCEANRTCNPQLAGLTCCLEDGTIVSVHLIVVPTAPRCQLRDVLLDAELVLSRD